MMGLGKHVHGVKFFDSKSRAGQFAQVPAQCGGVAGNIDQPFSGEGCKVWCKSRGALSGRVDNDAVKAFTFCYQCLATGMDGAFLEQGVGEACLCTVFSGTADG